MSKKPFTKLSMSYVSEILVWLKNMLYLVKILYSTPYSMHCYIVESPHLVLIAYIVIVA